MLDSNYFGGGGLYSRAGISAGWSSKSEWYGVSQHFLPASRRRRAVDERGEIGGGELAFRRRKSQCIWIATRRKHIRLTHQKYGIVFVLYFVEDAFPSKLFSPFILLPGPIGTKDAPPLAVKTVCVSVLGAENQSGRLRPRHLHGTQCRTAYTAHCPGYTLPL